MCLISPKMKKLYQKNRIYSEDEISDIALSNGMITIDCLKDEDMISVEEWDGKELGGWCLFEFDRVGEDKFLRRWSEFEKC